MAEKIVRPILTYADEAHNVKNPNAMRTTYVNRIAEKSVPSKTENTKSLDGEVIRVDEVIFKTHVDLTTGNKRYCQIDFVSTYCKTKSKQDICVVVYLDMDNKVIEICLVSKQEFFYTTGINPHYAQKK